MHEKLFYSFFGYHICQKTSLGTWRESIDPEHGRHPLILDRHTFLTGQTKTSIEFSLYLLGCLIPVGLSSAAKPVGPSPERRLGALRAQLIRQGYSRGYINMALKRHVTLEGALIYIKNVMSKRQQLYELRGNNGDKSVTRIKSIRDLTHQQNLLIFRKECLFRQTCYLWEDRLDRMENTLVRLSKKLDRCENPTICDCFECIPSKRRTRSLTETDHNLGVLSDLRPLEEKKGEPDGDSTDDEGTERTYTDESGGDDRDSKVDFAAPDQYASGESEGEDEEEKSAVESRTPSQRSDSELKDNSFDSDSRDRDISDDAIS